MNLQETCRNRFGSFNPFTPRPCSGGESSLLQKPYRYVVAQRVGVFAQFWSENGYIFAHFCLESDIIFEETTTGMYDPNCRFNSKGIGKKKKYANSKCI